MDKYPVSICRCLTGDNFLVHCWSLPQEVNLQLCSVLSYNYPVDVRQWRIQIYQFWCQDEIGFIYCLEYESWLRMQLCVRRKQTHWWIELNQMMNLRMFWVDLVHHTCTPRKRWWVLFYVNTYFVDVSFPQHKESFKGTATQLWDYHNFCSYNTLSQNCNLSCAICKLGAWFTFKLFSLQASTRI